MEEQNDIPLLDCPFDYLIGDASGKIMNEYARFPCKIKCGVYAYMVRGTAKATINITRYEFKEGDVLRLAENSFLLIHEFSEDALVYYVLFSSSFLEKNTFNMKSPLNTVVPHDPIIHLEEEGRNLVTTFAETLMRALNCSPSALSSAKMVHVYNFLQQCYGEYMQAQGEVAEQPTTRGQEIYRTYCDLVLKHYKHWHYVSEYADVMHLTLPHLCTTIKQVSGQPASELIVDAIMTDARAQLKITTLPIKEISASLGFENAAFFNRFFKSKLGVTPRVYRSTNM